MATQVYHLNLSEEEHTALISLHYLGTTLARAVKSNDIPASQRESLYHEWLDTLGKVAPTLQNQLNTTINQ